MKTYSWVQSTWKMGAVLNQRNNLPDTCKQRTIASNLHLVLAFFKLNEGLLERRGVLRSLRVSQLPADNLRSDERSAGSAIFDPGMFENTLSGETTRSFFDKKSLDQVFGFLGYQAPFTLRKFVKTCIKSIFFLR